MGRALPFALMTELLKLAIPIVLTYLGTMLMGFVDLLFVGRVSAEAMGAVGIGTSIFAWFLVFGLGLSSGLEYLVSHAHGANEKEKQFRFLVNGLFLVLVLSVPLTGLLVFLSLNLQELKINSDVLDQAKSYTYILSFSLVGSYVFNVFRLYLTAMGVARPPMVMLVIGNLVNALLDYLLVFGNLGAPKMGALGSAWATLTARFMMTICLGWYVVRWNSRHGYGSFGWKFRIDWVALKKMIHIGLPVAFQMMFEVGVFALATTLAAQLAADQLAAHQIVLNTASLTFMVPFGVSSATAVLVARYMGAKKTHLAVKMGWFGFVIGTGFMLFSCAFFLSFPDLILNFFTWEKDVVEMGKKILLIAALFQLADGIQTVGTGALRGLGETRSPMFFNFIGHWVLGLPVGALLCFQLQWGIQGLWTGLSLGLSTVAALVLFRWWKVTRVLSHKAAE